MNTLRSSLAITAAAFLLAHCGGNNGTGFSAAGSVVVQFSEGAGAPSETGLRFQSQVRIDPTLPSGRTSGVIGSCSVGPNSRTVEIDQIGGDALGFKSISVMMPDWSQDTCVTCQHGTVNLTVGSTSFVGEETRGGVVAPKCVFNATRRGSYGMELTVMCTALESNGKRASINATLQLDSCNGSMTRN